MCLWFNAGGRCAYRQHFKQEAVIKETEENRRINFPELKDSYTYDIINMLGSGKILIKCHVVAPDGATSDTIKLAEEHGINVHKIDPTMEEIRKAASQNLTR